MSDLASYNEKELLVKVSHGDEKAFRTLFDSYRNRLYFYILQLIFTKEIAEDITQDTFLKIWLHREQLSAVENFNAYIFRVAQNTVLTWLKRQALETEIIDRKLEPPGSDTDAGEKLHFKLVKEVLQKAVNGLPEQQKKVYVLRRENGLTIREIAKILGISQITVKRHLTEAQKNLRYSLEKSFSSDIGILSIILGLFMSL